jgi:hypothetical protein
MERANFDPTSDGEYAKKEDWEKETKATRRGLERGTPCFKRGLKRGRLQYIVEWHVLLLYISPQLLP